MRRYIDADKLINELEPVVKSAAFKNRNIRSNVNKCWEIVNNQPTADVRENVKGKWIIKTDGFVIKRVWGVCSECGNTLDFSGVNAGRGDANFCPNCGADMRGDQT